MSDDRLAKYLTLSHARSPKHQLKDGGLFHDDNDNDTLSLRNNDYSNDIITIMIIMAHDSCRNKCPFKRGK